MSTAFGASQPPASSPAGLPVRLGLGTWMMGESRRARRREVDAIVRALQIGYRLFDTAELYGAGGAERVIGEALRVCRAAQRSELYLVSKVKPSNASRRGTVAACEESIERLGCGYLDLYLLHWPGAHSFSATLEAFGELQQRGAVRRCGVSNFDVAELARWLEAERAVGLAGTTCCNQIYYCLSERGAEFDLLPWQRARGIVTMAYSPLGRGALATDPAAAQVGRRHGLTAAQVALAWCLRAPDVVAIPKSADATRLEENWRAAAVSLDAQDLAELDRTYPPPRSKTPLAMT